MHMTTEHLTKLAPVQREDKESRRFTTERLPLAVVLHATGGLPFLGCESRGNGKVRFVFEDPDHIGEHAELDFDRGAAVPATAIFASQRFLRRLMTETLGNHPRKTEYRKHGFAD